MRIKITLDDYQKVAKSRGGSFTLNEIPNRTKIKTHGWKCKEDHEWTASYTKIANDGSWCTECNGGISKNIKDYKAMAKKFSLEFQAKKSPASYNTKVKWYCPEHEVDWANSYQEMSHRKFTPCINCQEEKHGEIMSGPHGLAASYERDGIKECDAKEKKEESDEKANEENEEEIDIENEESEKENIVLDQSEYKIMEEKEETIFDCTLQLESGDQFIIPMRKDGSVSITEIAKAYNKKVSHWKALEETKAFLEAVSLNAGIPALRLLASSTGRYGGTFAHRLIAYHFAMWCNPQCALQVIKWTDELLLTGKVELGNEKSSKELDLIWKEKYSTLLLKSKKLTQKIKDKDEEIEEKNDEIKKQKVNIINLKKTVARHEKKHTYVKFGIDQPTYYIFSYGRRCHEDCILHELRKHGIAITDKLGPVDQRLANHRTTFKWLLLEFLVSGPADAIEALEKAMEARYGAKCETMIVKFTRI